jgi:hypothetical protein
MVAIYLNPPRSKSESLAKFTATAMRLGLTTGEQLGCGSSARLVLEIHIREHAEFLNRLLTRTPDFWLRSLLCRNWKHVLG